MFLFYTSLHRSIPKALSVLVPAAFRVMLAEKNWKIKASATKKWHRRAFQFQCVIITQELSLSVPLKVKASQLTQPLQPFTAHKSMTVLPCLSTAGLHQADLLPLFRGTIVFSCRFGILTSFVALASYCSGKGLNCSGIRFSFSQRLMNECTALEENVF